MKTMRIGLTTLGALFLATVLANAVFAADFASAGLTLRSSQRDGSQTVHELEDADGNRLTVIGGASLTDSQIQTVIYVHNALTGWKNMSFSSLRITMPGARAEAFILPERYRFEELDLTAYLPSGLQFYFDGILEYDFRMKVGSIFLRVNGPFIDEDQLTQRVAAAARDPIRFLERTDPAYLYLTLQEVTAALNELERAQVATEQNLHGLVSDYESLKSQRPALESKLAEIDTTGEQLRNADQTLTRAISDLASALVSLKGQKDELEARHNALVAEVGKLTEEKAALDAFASGTSRELDVLRTALLTLQNTGFLSGPRPMDATLVSRVLELRRGTATLTSAEILATLKTEGIKATKKQVELIILAYFGPVSS